MKQAVLYSDRYRQRRTRGGEHDGRPVAVFQESNRSERLRCTNAYAGTSSMICCPQKNTCGAAIRRRETANAPAGRSQCRERQNAPQANMKKQRNSASRAEELRDTENLIDDRKEGGEKRRIEEQRYCQSRILQIIVVGECDRMAKWGAVQKIENEGPVRAHARCIPAPIRSGAVENRGTRTARSARPRPPGLRLGTSNLSKDDSRCSVRVCTRRFGIWLQASLNIQTG